LEEYNESLRSLDKALELNSTNAVAWNNKGRVFFSQEKYEEAISCFDRALEIDRGYETAWVNKGLAWERLERILKNLLIIKLIYY
jgi:tetratricopeptide (TPR) repeat protein